MTLRADQKVQPKVDNASASNSFHEFHGIFVSDKKRISAIADSNGSARFIAIL
jgi:hypothetical protein